MTLQYWSNSRISGDHWYHDDGTELVDTPQHRCIGLIRRIQWWWRLGDNLRAGVGVGVGFICIGVSIGIGVDKRHTKWSFVREAVSKIVLD